MCPAQRTRHLHCDLPRREHLDSTLQSIDRFYSKRKELVLHALSGCLLRSHYASAKVKSIIAHEVGTSILLAATFATLLGLIAVALGYGPPMFPVVVGLGMLASMIIAATVGTLVPLILSRAGADPAVASGPFVTTSIDIAGIASFCLVAYGLL